MLLEGRQFLSDVDVVYYLQVVFSIASPPVRYSNPLAGFPPG
jgi:hypothetical protein